MAEVVQYWATLSIGDARKKLSPVQVRVTEAAAEAYMAAADTAARAATAVGTLLSDLAALSDGVAWTMGVEIRVLDDANIFPTANSDVYNFDKIRFRNIAGLERSGFSIPARSETAYTVGEDGVSVIIADPGGTAAVLAAIASVEAVVLDKFGNLVTVEGIDVVS